MNFSKRVSLFVLNTMSKRKISDYAGFNKILSESKNIVVLTGAGVSAESGIPVFRGAGGFWRTHRSQNLATPQAFAANPALVWEFYHYRRNVAFNAQPNNAHKALAEYEKICMEQGRQFTIITQNVDGLHARAGSKNIIELHGALHKVKCTKCRCIDENYDNPICEALRGRGLQTRFDRIVCIFFSEDLVESCDMCLVIGTSSVVYPAAMFAPRVAERGRPVAEFNLNDEPADDLFAFHFPGKCGETLPKALGITL
nr:NAD-dependent protein deacylase-like [Leptinotarsa decemlineata]